jgi:hypothetical protein
VVKKIIPIQVVADVERLQREVNAGSLSSSVVYLSLPIQDGRGTSLTVPLDYYMVGANRAAAWRFVEELSSFNAEPTKDKFAAFERRYRESWSQRSPEAWGLMLIFWYDVYRDEIDLNQHIALALAKWLDLDLAWFNPFRDSAWFSKLIGTRVTIRQSPSWRALMAYEETRRLHILDAAVDIGGPTIVRMALVVLSALPPVRGALAASVAIQSIIGLLDFLFTVWEGERDGEITEQEIEDAGFALLGIFGFGVVQLLVMGVRLNLLAFRVLTHLGEAALQLAAELPERSASIQAGFSEFVSARSYDEEGPDCVFLVLDD